MHINAMNSILFHQHIVDRLVDNFVDRLYITYNYG